MNTIFETNKPLVLFANSLALALVLALSSFVALAQDCAPTGRAMTPSQWRRACIDCGGYIVGRGSSMRCEFDAAPNPEPTQPSREQLEEEQRERYAQAFLKAAIEAEKRANWSDAAEAYRRALQKTPNNQDIKTRLKNVEDKIERERRERASQERIKALHQSIARSDQNRGGLPFEEGKRPDVELGFASPTSPEADATARLDFAGTPKKEPRNSGPILDFAEPDIHDVMQSRHKTVRELREQLAGIREALRRLNKTIASDASQRDEWKKATNDAMGRAWKRLKGMAVDEGLRFIGDGIDQQLASVNEQIKRAVTKLSGETDPAGRERLHAAVRLLNEQRDAIRDAQREAQAVLPKLKQTKKTLDTIDYAESNPGDLEKFLKGGFMLFKTALEQPKIQQALKFGGQFAKGAKYAESIVESSYDVTVELVAWKRIDQLNRNSEQYLWAVDRLQRSMEKTVRKIQEIEREKI